MKIYLNNTLGHLAESKKRGLDDPVEEGPLLHGIEVAVRDFMAGAVSPGMFF